MTFYPSVVLDVDVTEPLPSVDGSRTDGEPYRRAYILVRVHGHPVDVVQLEIPEQGLSPEKLSEAIQASSAEQIAAHTATEPCWAGELPDDDAPRISVVIATKDRTAELRKCLTTLLSLKYSNFEIVVVDNGASDTSTADMMSTEFASDPRVVYLNETTAGTSNARNRGVEIATGSIIAFTDDDVVVDSNWLRAIARRFAISPEVGCITGLVVPAEFESQAQEWFEEYGGFNKGFVPRMYTRERPADAGLLYPYSAGTFGSGNNAAFRKEALAQVGGFDTRLGPGAPTKTGEDLEVFLAIILSGGTIAYEPAAIIHHFHRADYDGLKRQIRNYGVGLTAIFTKWALSHPSYAWDIARRAPLGAWQVLSPTSQKNAKKTPDYPAELGKEELKGIIEGPLAWFKSVRAAKRH